MGEYITPQDLEIAKTNGIPENLAKDRFRRPGWSKKRAITEEVHGKKWSQYKELAEKHGVTKRAFYQRLPKMTPEEAATTPMSDPKDNLTPGGRKRDFTRFKNPLTEHDYQRAAKRGISRKLLDSRYYYDGWTKERAITQWPRNSLWARYKEKCEAIGLGKMGFYKRIAKGMTPDYAVSYPARGKKNETERNQAAN